MTVSLLDRSMPYGVMPGMTMMMIPGSAMTLFSSWYSGSQLIKALFGVTMATCTLSLSLLLMAVVISITATFDHRQLSLRIIGIDYFKLIIIIIISSSSGSGSVSSGVVSTGTTNIDADCCEYSY